LSAIAYRCPNCREALDERADAFFCGTCEVAWPVIEGIPDFRVYPDPYIDIEADREKGLRLGEAARRMTFYELVRYYYSITPEVPPDLAESYAAHHAAGVERGAGLVRRLERYGLGGLLGTDSRLLDVGCGTAGFLAAVAPRVGGTIGVDVAFRWLVVARKRLDELGLKDVTLVCACAEALPFAGGIADLVTAEGLIEHVKGNPARLLRELDRMRTTRGAIVARTVNRYAAGPEPHVHVWGVGYLPRRWMNRYVQWRRRMPYEHVRLRSARELRRAGRRAGVRGFGVRFPSLDPADYAHHGRVTRGLFAVWSFLGRWCPPLRPILSVFGPYVDVVARAR